ncbi:MAG: hypothetical protein WDZ49_10475 [Litorilinea sp.]
MSSVGRVLYWGNNIPIIVMSLLWLTPMLHFWGAVSGPLRPFSYPDTNVAPSLPNFLLWFLLSLLPYTLPAWYFTPWLVEQDGRLYEFLGIRTFKRFVPNGDLVNRLIRRTDPAYRFLQNRGAAQAFLDKTRSSERGHLVLLFMGIFTAVYALRIDWHSWAIGLTIGNVVFNVYPIMLQRYNRLRITRIIQRGDDKV